MTIKPGIISLVRFPHSDLVKGKYRPVIVLTPLPGPYDDWLICAVTSQLHHKIDDWDEVIAPADSDFKSSGLKIPSLIRLSKLAAINSSILEGILGEISKTRVRRLLNKLAKYLEEQSKK